MCLGLLVFFWSGPNFQFACVPDDNRSTSLATSGEYLQDRDNGETALYNEINYPIIQKHGQQVNT